MKTTILLSFVAVFLLTQIGMALSDVYEKTRSRRDWFWFRFVCTLDMMVLVILLFASAWYAISIR